MSNILDFVKQKYSEALQKLGSIEHQAAYSGSKYIEQAKTQLSQAPSKAQQIVAQAFDNAKNTVGIPNSWNTPIPQNSILGKFGQGVMAADNFLTTAPVISDIGYKIPQEYGTQAGNLIGTGLQQTVNGRPSNVPFTKIPVSGHIAGPAKVGLGLLGLTPGAIPGDYAMSAAESAATPVFGKDSLATTGIGLVAGLVAPTSLTGEAGKAENFLSKLDSVGQKELQALPKEERLSWLVHYQGELQKMGYKLQDIQKISAPRAFAIVKNAIDPSTFATRAKNIAEATAKAQEKLNPLLNGAKEAYQSWVNTRNAGDWEAAIQKRQFAALDKEGMNGIINFQAGQKTGMFKDVQNFFDQKYQELQKAGLKFGYRENYLPQLWANSQEQVDNVFGKTLNRNPGFTFQRTVEDYITGMENGLTPKYNTISELAASYNKTVNKALADKQFFDFLASKKFILPQSKAPQDWVSLDNNLFPRLTQKIDNKVYSGNYAAEPELAKLINNYLQNPEGKVADFASLATRVKNIGLGGGIPGTGFNYHMAVNIFRRDLLTANNPVDFVQKAVRDVKWMAKPNGAAEFLDQNLQDASYFAKHGLTITGEDWNKFTKEVPTSLFGKVEKGWEKWMGDPTFQKILPAIKLSFAKGEQRYLISTGMDAEKAASIASEHANTIYGGINLAELGRSKETQNLLRAFTLAPDWYESTIRTGTGMVKGVTHLNDSELKVYRTMTRNVLVNYIMENLINKALSGHWMFQNQGVSNQTSIDTGTYDANGQKRYLATWGTAQDMVRVPYQIIAGIAQGDISAIFNTAKNRFSIPGSTIAHLTMNQDYMGRPIYGKDKYGNPIGTTQQVGGITNEILNGLGIPPQIRAGIDWATGRASGEQAVAQSLEAPVRYSGGAYTPKQIQTVQDLKSVGASGEQINQAIHSGSTTSTPTNTGGNWLSNLFNGGKQPAEPTDPLTAALQKQSDLSEKQKEVRDIFAMNLSKEQTTKLLQQKGLGSYEDNALYMMRTLQIESGARPDYIQSLLRGLNNGDFQKLVTYLAENKVLTTSVTGYWADNGSISDAQKKTIDNMIKVANGKSVSTGYKKPTFPSLKSSVPKRTPIKIQPLPKLQDYNSWKVVQPKL